MAASSVATGEPRRRALPLREDRPIRLLQADPSLGDGLDPDRFSAAQDEVVAASALLRPSGAGASWAPEGDRSGFALMIASGLLVRQLVIGGRRRSELLGAGDVLRPWDSEALSQLPIDASARWRVPIATRVAYLDQPFLESVRSWPEITAAILTRAAGRAESLSVLLALSCADRIEDRLALVLWHLAQRWGRVTPRGVRLDLPLTHELLAEVVGARRPTVTTALARLSDAGAVVRDASGSWLLETPKGWDDTAAMSAG